MNTYTMLNMLGSRLEDLAFETFPETFRMQCINDSVNFFVREIHPKYISGMELVYSNLAITTGATAALNSSTLGNTILGGDNGIIKVRDYTTGTWMLDIGIENTQNNQNIYSRGTLRNPLYYVFANKIYVLPATGITAVDIFFVKTPSKLHGAYTVTSGSVTTLVSTYSSSNPVYPTYADYYNNMYIYNATKDVYYAINDFSAEGYTCTFTIDETQSGDAPAAGNLFYILKNSFDLSGANYPYTLAVEPEFDAAFHEIIVSLAEAECFQRSGEEDRRDSARNFAMAQIKYFNSIETNKYGLGTAQENGR